MTDLNLQSVKDLLVFNKLQKGTLIGIMVYQAVISFLVARKGGENVKNVFTFLDHTGHIVIRVALLILVLLSSSAVSGWVVILLLLSMAEEVGKHAQGFFQGSAEKLEANWKARWNSWRNSRTKVHHENTRLIPNEVPQDGTTTFESQ